ncbi:hypothetical protein [Sphingomonas sp. PP-CC-1A-547]|uniref:hypothetical protein n=1 Tax=Sphingomonas sp. PP-CC-1A-547 TaxID=2135654 RepID=UPI000E7713D5|nr:hypothetical protein [Sphingomonas sp. PP-CC-1A-547]RKE50320.1 hypothetical protein C8J39_1890 [Sphingomonas sp. PP-CC-1A-547]
MTDLTDDDLDALSRKLRGLEDDQDGSFARTRLLDILIDIVGVQADMMVSIAQERLGEPVTAKSSLTAAATKLTAVVAAIRAEHERNKLELAERKTAVASIKAVIDEQH